MNITKIPPDDLTIIIQGPLHVNSLSHIDHYLSFGKVVVSFWDEDDASITDQYKSSALFISQPIDKATIRPLESRRYASPCYQSATTLNGLNLTETKWAIKVRSDEYYTDLNALLDKMHSQPNKIVTGNVFYKNNNVFKYHIGDHLMGGITSNMRGLFERVLSNYENDYFKELNETYSEHMTSYKDVNELCSESMISISFLLYMGEPPEDIFLNDAKDMARKYFDVIPIDDLGEVCAMWGSRKRSFSTTETLNNYLNKKKGSGHKVICSMDEL